jgi:hypothetical protein
MDAPNLQTGSDKTQMGWPETLNALSRQTSKLEFLLLMSFIVIIVLSVGLNVLLANQVKVLQARYNEQNPAVKQLAKGFRENDEPLYRKFALALQQYAATNRDFLPIWEKYRPAMTNLLTAAKPLPSPAAAQPVQPAKK